MKRITVVTSDNKIWNQEWVYADIAQAMTCGTPFVLDFISEAPDLDLLGMYNFLTVKAQELAFDLSKITVLTANALEQHSQIKIVYLPPIHLLGHARDYIAEVPKHPQLKHFGIFIGRSNAQRLHLATYLDSHYQGQTIMSYHLNFIDDFHTSNIGLEDLIKNYGIQDVRNECNFIHRCPIRLRQDAPVVIDKSLSLNPSQQLLLNDQAYFAQTYQDFFVEIVCESFFTGRTFFPTEKIFRPILLKTPFIVQGPQNFLHNLRTLGFQTFSNWWDEGYAEDPDGQQVQEIKKLLDTLATKTPIELHNMYTEMLTVLEHNHEVARSLTVNNFIKLFK
jgi:hypothetical protein